MVRTFNKDTVIFFDRTEFNLKGYKYHIEGEYIFIYEKDLPRLKAELGDRLYEWAIDFMGGDIDRVAIGEEDFIQNETFNPFELDRFIRQLNPQRELTKEFAERQVLYITNK